MTSKTKKFDRINIILQILSQRLAQIEKLLYDNKRPKIKNRLFISTKLVNQYKFSFRVRLDASPAIDQWLSSRKIPLEVKARNMIRMGRGSSVREQSNDTQNYQEQESTSNNYYQYASVSEPDPARSAISDSESMARDIKEGRLSGYVGNGTVLTGETSFQAMLRIDGHLTGRISSESGTLIVGSSGRVDANIAVASAIVSGTVNGDIVASEKLELTRTARVVGNIQAPRLVIDDGAVFEGSCSMLKAKKESDKRSPKVEYPAYDASTEVAETVETEAEAVETVETAAN
jgi:cytoskeletal protein CcmA (bactofilin family)